jgi:hypothetical protein
MTEENPVLKHVTLQLQTYFFFLALIQVIPVIPEFLQSQKVALHLAAAFV